MTACDKVDNHIYKLLKGLLPNNKRKKRRILIGILAPLTVFGVALGVALPLTMYHSQSSTWAIRNYGANNNFEEFLNGNAINGGITTPKQAFSDYLDHNKVDVIEFDFNTNISIANGAFYDCVGLNNPLKRIAIEFRALATSIGEGAFNGCASLTGFSKGSQSSPIVISSVGTDAFYGCANLDATKINSSIITLSGCTWTPGTGTHTIDSGYWRKNADPYLYSAGCLAVGTIPCPFFSIVGDAFDGCASLTQINNIPGGAIDTQAFYDCINLVTVQFKNDAPLTSIGGGAFSGCSNLQNIKLSIYGWDNTKQITDDAFYGCPNDGGTISGTNAQDLLDAIQNKGFLTHWKALPN